MWQSERGVDNMLQSYEKESEKVCALKCQLRFRKEVLLQVAENKSTFNFSKSVVGTKSRKSLNATELAENLKILIRQANVKDAESNEEKHILGGKRVKHRFIEGGAGKWYKGKIISQVNHVNPTVKIYLSLGVRKKTQSIRFRPGQTQNRLFSTEDG